MKKNIGTIDKVVRIAIAVVFAILFFANVINGVLGFILLALAGILVLSSLISFCPLYWPLGISTDKKTE